MEVDAQRLKEMLETGEVELVDVREDYEVEAARIPGSRHVDLSELGGAADSFDRERPIVFYCRSGERSAMAADAFEQGGFQAYNLSGGILAWQEAGLVVEPEDGEVVQRHVH
jgi:rhodanese-related sulfurtransferase